MKRIYFILGLVVLAIIGIVILKHGAFVSSFVWSVSKQGIWLLPLVLVSSILDSVHPCSFSILLVTIALLFSLQMKRSDILRIGGAYIAGIFAAYLLIGLGILKVLHLFNTPHFMGKLGAAILIIFGVLNILNDLFPKFPIRLKIPTMSHTTLGRLMEKASIPAIFVLGALVGICQFPCMGGAYLMVIGLLRDQMTYFSGFGYLVLYNLVLIIPLVTVLWIVSDKTVVDKVQVWKSENLHGLRFWTGVIMLAIGLVILYI